MITTCRDRKFYVLLPFGEVRIDNLEAFKLGPQRLSQRVLRGVLRVNEAVPAGKAFYVLDAHDICSVVRIILEIVLMEAGRGYSLSGMLQGLGQVFHASSIIDLTDSHSFRSVDINKDLLVQEVILSTGIPEWVDHENVFSRFQLDALIEERKSETVAEASIYKLSTLRHKHNIEVSGFKKFARIFLPIILQPITLLVARDGE